MLPIQPVFEAISKRFSAPDVEPASVVVPSSRTIAAFRLVATHLLTSQHSTGQADADNSNVPNIPNPAPMEIEFPNTSTAASIKEQTIKSKLSTEPPSNDIPPPTKGITTLPGSDLAVTPTELATSPTADRSYSETPRDKHQVTPLEAEAVNMLRLKESDLFPVKTNFLSLIKLEISRKLERVILSLVMLNIEHHLPALDRRILDLRTEKSILDDLSPRLFESVKEDLLDDDNKYLEKDSDFSFRPIAQQNPIIGILKSIENTLSSMERLLHLVPMVGGTSLDCNHESLTDLISGLPVTLSLVCTLLLCTIPLVL